MWEDGPIEQCTSIAGMLGRHSEVKEHVGGKFSLYNVYWYIIKRYKHRLNINPSLYLIFGIRLTNTFIYSAYLLFVWTINCSLISYYYYLSLLRYFWLLIVSMITSWLFCAYQSISQSFIILLRNSQVAYYLFINLNNLLSL